MSQTIHLNAELRSDSGKGASRRLRKEGMVLAIVYGGEREPAKISLTHNEFIHELDNEAIYTQVIELRVGDRQQDVILRDLQRHPYKNRVLHADFYRIDQNKTLHITVPIHLANAETCYGVKTEGGMLTQLINELEIIALPRNLPEYLEIDVQDLHLGDTLRLTDITPPEGVEIVALSHLEDVEDIEHDTMHNLGVVSVIMPREEEIEEEAPEDLEAPELLGEEGEEGEEASAEDKGDERAGGEDDDKRE